MDGLRNELTEKVRDLSVCSWGGVCYGGWGVVEWWWCCVCVFKVDVGFVVECMIGGISLWGGGSFRTIMELDVSVSSVVWVPYLELVLLATGTVGLG